MKQTICYVCLCSPSEKVSGAGCFGAALMTDSDFPNVLRLLRTALHPSTPLTVKCRIGVDQYAILNILTSELVLVAQFFLCVFSRGSTDSYEFFEDFVLRLHDSGITEFIVHARKAWLSGVTRLMSRLSLIFNSKPSLSRVFLFIQV